MIIAAKQDNYKNFNPEEFNDEQNFLNNYDRSLISDKNFLEELDVQNFNYFIFEDDLDGLDDHEFELIYDNFLHDFLLDIDDKFLELNFEETRINLTTIEEKKKYIKSIIYFLTWILPYDILKPLLSSKDEEILQILRVDPETDPELLNESDFKKILDIDYNGNLDLLKNKIIELINDKNKKLNNWIERLTDLSQVSKKDTLEDSLEILEQHVAKQQAINTIYTNIIKNTDLEKILKLFEIYLKKDFYNIVY